MSSGMNISKDCTERFDELKLGHKYSYIIYKLDKDLKNIVVDCCGEKGDSYDSFHEKLVEAANNKEGRYAVLDCEYEKDKNKIVFMMWNPDNVTTKQKMIYSSSKGVLKQKLVGVGKELQCNDLDDISWENVSEACKSKYDK